MASPDRHRILPLLLTAAAAALIAMPSDARAQRGFEWPERAQNLKVLPKNTPKEKLRGIMTGFTRALGVRCPHCHVGQEGQPLETFDFPSDKNPKKEIARGMVRMLGRVNADIKRMKLTNPNRVTVGCHTCHHGRPQPRTLAEELAEVYGTAGIDSTLSHYRALRDRFYGRDAYDFGEGTLHELAQTVLAKGRHDDAIAILRLNVEQNPGSGRAVESLGDAHMAAGQKEAAIQSYRRALEIDPTNKSAERKFQDLAK